jgi:A/G-specific adenine glycosylase
LAGASRADVVRAWAGLGYHRRAVALHEAARAVVREHGGRLPRAAGDLRALPGIGPYTAAAVASIAFGEPVPAIDVNVRRIVARAVMGAEPDEVPAGEVAAAAADAIASQDPGAWNQAMMDLGREVCRPAPRCPACPLRPWCRFAATGRTGRPSGRRQPPFEGSVRQVRGRIVDALRTDTSLGVGDLPSRLGVDPAGVDAALAGLARDGIVVAARGRVRLATGPSAPSAQ